MAARENQVMVVDDSGALGFTMSLEFRAAGWGVFCCGSGEEALKKLDDAPFDLLITDIQMPGMSGIELAHKVRDHHPRTMVLVMSGLPREEVKGLPVNVAFLPKPVDVKKILKAYEQQESSRNMPPPPVTS